MHVRIVIQKISKALNGSNHRWNTVAGIGIQSVHVSHGPVGLLVALRIQLLELIKVLSHNLKQRDASCSRGR